MVSGLKSQRDRHIWFKKDIDEAYSRAKNKMLNFRKPLPQLVRTFAMVISLQSRNIQTYWIFNILKASCICNKLSRHQPFQSWWIMSKRALKSWKWSVFRIAVSHAQAVWKEILQAERCNENKLSHLVKNFMVPCGAVLPIALRVKNGILEKKKVLRPCLL